MEIPYKALILFSGAAPCAPALLPRPPLRRAPNAWGRARDAFPPRGAAPIAFRPRRHYACEGGTQWGGVGVAATRRWGAPRAGQRWGRAPHVWARVGGAAPRDGQRIPGCPQCVGGRNPAIIQIPNAILGPWQLAGPARGPKRARAAPGSERGARPGRRPPRAQLHIKCLK